MSKTHSIVGSLKYAKDGLTEATRNEPNFRFHLLVAVAAAAAAIVLKFSETEWIVLILVIAAVLVLELINTALEALVDIVSPAIRKKARIAKDVMSSAVLVASVAAVVVGAILFGPKVWLLLS